MLQVWRCRGKQSGLFLARAIPVACALSLLYSAAASSTLKQTTPDPLATWNCCVPAGNVRRQAAVRELESRGGQHLVFVRYGPAHDYHDEWVYNEADIDNAPVVWAREMDADSNRQLIEYFSTRQVWMIEPDNEGAGPRPYTPGSGS
jgi:hypothetical protein